ncbi:MAG: UDP-N-acetylmuramate--L-alanine ligase, partial [Anaerolineae bacterium]|nr:UDP-N-acetylmuramate--L-alanine ligase [Anaerolineae bacterium]
IKNLGTNAGAGLGEHFVIEADEYDHMFLGLNPGIAVVNNVEYDHPDFFHTPHDMLAAFQKFVDLLGIEGVLVACADDGVALELAEERRKQFLPVLTYGVENKNADWWAVDLKPNAKGGTDFVVCHAEIGGGVIGPVSLQLIGTHNVRNAMAVVAVARHIGVPFEAIAEALAKFEGTERRSEVMGDAGGVKVVNDYAHHPTAIMMTLKAWRERVGAGSLWAVWQPHTYSRTRALADSFKDAFGAAHHVLVTDIFAAREIFTPGLDAKGLAAMMNDHPDARYSGDLFETAQILTTEVKAGDIVVLLSAGDAPRIGHALLDVLNKRNKPRV